ncbi:MAG: hypothetical protein U0521_06405 [Anaerolineae bacterium]
MSPQPPTTTGDAQVDGTATHTSPPRAHATTGEKREQDRPGLEGQRETTVPLTASDIVYFAERDNNFDIYRMNPDARAERG